MIAESLAIDAARHTLYQFLGAVTGDPVGKRWAKLSAPDYLAAVSAAAALLQGEPPVQAESLAPGELPLEQLNLMPLLDFLQHPREQVIKEHQTAYGLTVSKECPPYETEYCPQTFSVYRSHHLADIAGYYKAFGLEPSPSDPERHDHISLELEFMAWLIAKELYVRESDEPGSDEKASICRDAQTSFFRDHLAWWAPAFGFALRRKVDGLVEETELASPSTNLLGSVARLLAAFVPYERATLNVKPPETLIKPSPTPDAPPCESKHT